MEPAAGNPNYMVLPTPPPQPQPQPQPVPTSHNRPIFSFSAIRITNEFDSESATFFHKISWKFMDRLAKFKFSFNNNNKGDISEPQISFVSKYLSLHYDLEDHNALVKSSFDVGPRLQVTAAHDIKAQQGEVTMVTNVADTGYALELSTAVPSVGLPKATFRFPVGEVSLQEKEEDEVKNLLSVSGILKGQFLNGLYTAQYKDEELKLRYCYKDDEMSFIPILSLPSNALSFAFKRRLGPSDKLSYWYNCDSNYWSAVYKRTYGKDFKFKAGYDSEVRLGWASLWVGDEGGKAKTAPMKMKVQFMLQVPQDDIKSSFLMFRIKKRWDI
ncbi:outer envelope pore protein 37, chloroplastic [Gastrolobium bilobum]|uniref:outer envelope pore protein 37, chloroplastic n=1 Tax=Gastrolobium bilobum TaxID=150636 RepID=UPI002AB081DF|nr:outer envelope pore protein 37, chloroplastic [Gastrolobium bilobum]